MMSEAKNYKELRAIFRQEGSIRSHKKGKSPRRTVKSSLNMCLLISWGNRAAVKEWRRYYSSPPQPLSTAFFCSDIQ
jgi:hypothetical protein